MNTPDLVYGWDSLRKVFAEPNLRELIELHWEELAVHKEAMRLNPDFDRFIALEDAGIFRAWTARDGKTLAGYVGVFIQPHIHYKDTLTAVEDLFLLAPQYRRGTAGARMFASLCAALAELGVKRVILHTKVHFEQERGGLGPFFERLGFTHTDDVWSKYIG